MDQSKNRMRRRSTLAAAVCVVAVATIGAASAQAAVRYAAPGGTGPSPCLEANPCSLYTAASYEASGGAQAGDEIIALPGIYSGTADLGPAERVIPPIGSILRGAPGPMPMIQMEATNALLQVEKNVTVSHLRIRGGRSWRPLNISLGTAEGVIVSDQEEDAITCRLSVKATLRDSACLSHGPHGVAVKVLGGADAAFYDLQTLRSVTAVADGVGSVGLLLENEEGEVFVKARSIIAEGTAFDIEAIAVKANAVGGVQIEHSDYETVNEVALHGGHTFITEAGTHYNITAPALLEDDQVHELAGSPTVDHGVVDEYSGGYDVDGNARVVGAAPDIGADEMATPTSTTLECRPASVIYGQESSCAATVTAADSQSVGGTVELVIPAPSDPRRSTCALSPSGPAAASCVLPFKAADLESTMDLLATYSGDATHGESSAAAQVAVGPDPTATAVSCSPSTLVSGQSTTCTVTVTNDGPSDIAATGHVGISTTESVLTPGSGSCDMAVAGPGRSTCQVTLRALLAVAASTAGSPAGTISAEVVAEYRGDAGHLGSKSGASAVTASWPARTVGSPQTTLGRKPPRRTRKRRATFTFTSTDPGARFRCRVDKARFRPCHSPDKVKVGPGRHVFEVKAVDASGADPTPARFRWTVRRPTG